MRAPTGRLAGWLYLALVPFSIFGMLYVPSALVVEDDAAATAGNILAHEWLFRSGVVSHLVAQILFVCLGFALYRLLKPVNKSQARLMVTFALLSVPIGFVSEMNRLAALELLSGPGYLEPFTPVQLRAQAMLSLDAWGNGVPLMQVFWGLWLLPLGYLVFRSGFLPRILGILLIIAGAGHLVAALLAILAPEIDVAIGRFASVGELLFLLWLLFKGVNVEQWRQVAGEV